MTDTPNWKPSDEMMAACDIAWRETGDVRASIIKRIRPLIIADEKPKIEAAERERIAALFDFCGQPWMARDIRASAGHIAPALKDSKP